MSHSTTDEDNLQIIVRPQSQTASGYFLVDRISSGALGIQTFIFAVFATLAGYFGISMQIPYFDDEGNEIVVALQREVEQLRQARDAQNLEIENLRSERDSAQETADRQGALIPRLVSEVTGHAITQRTQDERLAKLEHADQAQRSQISDLQANTEVLRKDLQKSEALRGTLQAQNQLLTGESSQMKETLARQTDEMDGEKDRKALQEKVELFTALSNELYSEKSTILGQLDSTILKLSNTRHALSDITEHSNKIGIVLKKLGTVMKTPDRSFEMDSEMSDESLMVILTLTHLHNRKDSVVGRGTGKDTSRAEEIAIASLACEFVKNAYKFPSWPWALDQPSSTKFKFGPTTADSPASVLLPSSSKFDLPGNGGATESSLNV
ncbi:hypothetical protein BDP27DRAFT_1323746 [Rhodocollybia butyracea]|uniref:Uncharacterized protein n=1 Tax=Rhodocollybia butyracea TaxID=206335 RepID=A0A9P5PV15_9AGAR|nr:hypothetical protein BDP27DRAFT_1323746 [Rhodocollybia butyracea]